MNPFKNPLGALTGGLLGKTVTERAADAAGVSGGLLGTKAIRAAGDAFSSMDKPRRSSSVLSSSPLDLTRRN